jgi:outer membrane receptor protein involved in Fe transport
MKYIFQINLLILCIMPGLLLAQEDRLTPQIGMEVQEAGDLVFHPDSSRLKIISTGRFSKNLDDLPLKVYVISHEEILNNQYNTLTDVLNSLPGMRVSQPGSGELGETFQVWGFTGNMYSKILVNGVPVKPSAVTGMPIGSQLPVRQADKIEVVYGNASAVYGADAVAGVINIITKESEQDLFVRGDISLGQGNYYYTNFFIGGKGGRNNNILNYSFYGSISGLNDLYVKEGYEEAYNPLNYYRYREEPLTINGVEYPPGEIDEALIIEAGSSVEEFNDENYGPGYEGTLTRPEMENLGCASHMLGLQLRFKGIGFSYNNMYRRTHSSIGLSPVFFKYNNPQNYWGEVIQRALLSYERDFRRVSSSTHLSFLSFAMDNTSSQGVTFFEKMDKLYRYSVSNDLFFEQTFSVSPAKNLEVIGGFSYKQSGALPVTNFLYTPFDRADYNLFRVEVNLDTISDRFGYNPTSYNNLSGFLQSYYRTGKFSTLELGFKTTLLRRLMIDQTYFYYRITDHIIPREFATAPLGLELAANDSVRIWINNREAVSNVYGVMTTLRVNDIIASVRLNAELNLTFQDRKDEIPDVVELVTDQLSLTPKHSGKLKITMEPLKRMYVNIESHWMTKWLRILIPVEEWYDELFAETDGYYAMNVLLSYGLSDNLKVYMKVTNLFNEKYGNVNAAFLDENLIYNPQLARYIRFGLSYQLK